MDDVFFMTVFNGEIASSQNALLDATLETLFFEARFLCQAGVYGSVNFLSNINTYTCATKDVLKVGVVFAMSNNLLVGALLFRTVHDECEIEHIAVAEQKKRKGIGFALMKQLNQFVTDQGVKKIFLEVGVRNLGAQALYAKIGFLPIGKRTLYYRNSEDAIVMEKQV